MFKPNEAHATAVTASTFFNFRFATEIPSGLPCACFNFASVIDSAFSSYEVMVQYRMEFGIDTGILLQSTQSCWWLEGYEFRFRWQLGLVFELEL